MQRLTSSRTSSTPSSAKHNRSLDALKLSAYRSRTKNGSKRGSDSWQWWIELATDVIQALDRVEYKCRHLLLTLGRRAPNPINCNAVRESRRRYQAASQAYPSQSPHQSLHRSPYRSPFAGEGECVGAGTPPAGPRSTKAQPRQTGAGPQGEGARWGPEGVCAKFGKPGGSKKRRVSPGIFRKAT